MSPEIQFRYNDRTWAYEGRMSDLWSIGCILQYMVYGDDIKLEHCHCRDCIDFKSKIEKHRKHKRSQLEMQICRWDNVTSNELKLANDLQTKFMNLNPADRATAPKALQHPWFHFHDQDKKIGFKEL